MGQSETSQREVIQQAINTYRTMLEDEDQHHEDALRVALLIAYQAGKAAAEKES